MVDVWCKRKTPNEKFDGRIKGKTRLYLGISAAIQGVD
jgi:hypothetical protein